MTNQRAAFVKRTNQRAGFDKRTNQRAAFNKRTNQRAAFDKRTNQRAEFVKTGTHMLVTYRPSVEDVEFESQMFIFDSEPLLDLSSSSNHSDLARQVAHHCVFLHRPRQRRTNK